jgi:hypothetical protein
MTIGRWRIRHISNSQTAGLNFETLQHRANLVEAFLKSNISQKKFCLANLNWSVNYLFSPEFQPD